MGSVRRRVARGGRGVARIASVVKVGHLVVAGVSNWGAYGIVAELARLSRRAAAAHAEEEQRMIDACVEAGAVDGLTRRREPTVDGLLCAAHIGMLELLLTIIMGNRIPTKGERVIERQETYRAMHPKSARALRARAQAIPGGVTHDAGT